MRVHEWVAAGIVLAAFATLLIGEILRHLNGPVWQLPACPGDHRAPGRHRAPVHIGGSHA